MLPGSLAVFDSIPSPTICVRFENERGANNRASMQLTSRKLESQQVSYCIYGCRSREAAVLSRRIGRATAAICPWATEEVGVKLTSVTSF